jgi:flagellar biosynthesis/type III secretory pathway chaperone
MADQDQDVMNNIQRLVNEEHELFERGSLTGDEQKRLQKIQVELDQCWDLLRQRRARREFGEGPDQAHVRPPEVVEKYTG